MKKILTKICVLFAFSIPFSGCDDVEELINMLNCQFEVQEVEDFTFAGVPLNHLDSLEEISVEDRAIIQQAIDEDNAPMHFTLNVLGTNPNNVVAAVEKLEWKLEIDNQEVTGGVVPSGFTIPAQSTNTLTLDITSDVTDVFQENVLENVFNLYQDLKHGRTTNVKIKIKPTINEVEFPDYITLMYPIKNEE